MQFEIPRPYLLFLGEQTSRPHAKTAFGLRDWAPDLCVGEFALPGATVSTGLPMLTPALAHARGARSLVIGVAPVGGSIPVSWSGVLNDALEAGLDVVNGLHTRLEEIPGLAATAERLGRRLINVRQPPTGLPIATGRRRTGKRLLTVGTDCALGKKYTALSLARGLRSRGIAADFRATGQTGILIAGGGIPIDAVVSDFAAEPRCSGRPLGHRRRSGLYLSPGLFRRVLGSPPWDPARRHRHVPRGRARSHCRVP